MRDIFIVLVHSIVTIVRLIKPGGLRAVVAESALTRHQLLILNRCRKRAPNLRVSDRLIAGLCTLLMRPSRMRRCPKAIDVAAFPSRTDQTGVPHAGCVQARSSAWSEGAGPRIDRCRRGN